MALSAEINRFLESVLATGVPAKEVNPAWHKGEFCQYASDIFCQEGYCSECRIGRQYRGGEDGETEQVSGS